MNTPETGVNTRTDPQFKMSVEEASDIIREWACDAPGRTTDRRAKTHHDQHVHGLLIYGKLEPALAAWNRRHSTSTAAAFMEDLRDA